MKKPAAEPYRNIDFTGAKRGAVIPPEPGKTKISIRLDNAVVDYFRRQVEDAGAGNYQTLINDALVALIQQRSMLDAVRQVVREELAQADEKGKLGSVASKGQVTIPKALRQRLDIRRGSRIEFSLEGDHVLMRVRSSPPTEPVSGVGLLKSRRTAVPTDLDPASLVER